MHQERYKKVLARFCKSDDVVIVAPLNWGLGHAARCIPFIKYLQSHCRKVVIAADGDALQLLKMEFPHLESLQLGSYRVQYRFNNILLNVLLMVPSLLRALVLDLQSAESLVKTHGATVIISDNRLTFSNEHTVNLYMTHQYNILHHYKWVSRLASSLHQFFIRRFDACLIPDLPGNESLCPALSGTETPEKYFIGPLTRIEYKPQPARWDIIFLPTGPEPQRSFFAKKVSEELAIMKEYRIVMVGSKSFSDVYASPPPHIEVVEWPDAYHMEELLNTSRLLISRSGYTTIMDIFKLPLKAILIPTPGQTEQQYLARFHKNRPGFAILEQNHINIIQKTIKSLI
jgi:hypothetical protein